MTQETVTIAKELAEALTAYGRDRGVSSDLNTVVDVALRDHSGAHGYLVLLRPFHPFRITPIEHEGEETDISINHDRYFADGELGRPR